MRSPRPRLIAGLLLVPLLTGCFASSDGGRAAGPDGPGDGGRQRGARAVPPPHNNTPDGKVAYRQY
ncbi:ABC transporter substrate-binding protein, partial [Streptomyces xiamenensis]